MYAAVAGYHKGIQVIDLIPSEGALRCGAAEPGGPGVLEISAAVQPSGDGFFGEAIVQSIFVPMRTCDMSQLAELSVLDLPVDGLTQPVVVATAAVRRDLTIADVAEYIDVYYIQHAVTVTSRASSRAIRSGHKAALTARQ